MDRWNKARWIACTLLAGVMTQAALVYAALYFRQAAHGTPAFWNGGYTVLWSLWAVRFWMLASTIRRKDGAEVNQNPLGTIVFLYVSAIWTLFSYLSAVSVFLVVACLTVSLSVTCTWYQTWRQLRMAGPRHDAS